LPDLPAAGSLPAGDSHTKILARLAAELRASHLEGIYGFVNALKLEKDPDAQEALQTWVNAGMNIGSHTWSHMPLTSKTAEEFEQDISLNEPSRQTRPSAWTSDSTIPAGVGNFAFLHVQ
jgi:hypothetical protein